MRVLFIAAALVPMLIASLAQARIVVHSAAELEKGAAYENALVVYQKLSAANVIFAQCTLADYPNIAADRPYLAEQFPLAGQALVKAYYDKYVELVGYPPPQALIDESVARMSKLQQTIANDTARMIRKQGCRVQPIERTVTYVFQNHAIAKATKEATERSQP